MKNLKISVVISALNEEKSIGRFIDSIKKSSYRNFEIVVVDGGSKDRTKKIAKSKGAKVIDETGNKGCANAKNQGSAAARGAVLVHLDADNIGVSKDFLKHIAERFLEKDVVAVAPVNKKVLGSFWEKAHHESRRFLDFCMGIPKAMVSSGGGGWFPLAISKKVFFELGGYPNVGCEDRIFLRKFNEYCRKKGVVCAKSEESILYSKEPHTLGEILRQHEWYSRVTIPYIKYTGDLKEVAVLVLALLQPFMIAGIFLLGRNPVLDVLAFLYLLKMALLLVYIAAYRKAEAVMVPFLDFFAGIWKYYGLARLVKMKIARSDRINSRAD